MTTLRLPGRDQPHTTPLNLIPAANLKQPYYGFSAPHFSNNPLVLANAIKGSPYAASLASSVTDTSANETLTFEKLSGPGWLGIAATGGLSGTPGAADLGPNQFGVRVTDATGFVSETGLRVLVIDLDTPPQIVINRSGGNVNLLLTGIPGQHYRVEVSTTLHAASWEIFQDIPSLPSSPYPLTDTITNPRRFYRAVSLP